jgi:hypothetical protein
MAIFISHAHAYIGHMFKFNLAQIRTIINQNVNMYNGRDNSNSYEKLEVCQYGLELCFNVTHSMYPIPPFLILFLPPETRRDEPEADICAFKLIQH